MHNVVISIGGSSNWFEFQNNKTDIIHVNEKKDFISKISVPYNTSIGSYKFSLNLNSNEIGYKKDFIVRVFGTREDLLLYKIQSLRNNLSELETKADEIETKGINLTSARNVFYQIKRKLDLAEEQVHNKMYAEVTGTIREVEKLFIEAEYDVFNPPKIKPEEIKKIELPSISSKDVLLFSSGIGIVLLLISLIYLVRKVKKENKIRIPNLRLKELIIESKRLKELEEKIEKIKEAQEIIEEEYREKMISKESYDELRLKYQEKLLELEGERKKIRGY